MYPNKPALLGRKRLENAEEQKIALLHACVGNYAENRPMQMRIGGVAEIKDEEKPPGRRLC